MEIKPNALSIPLSVTGTGQPEDYTLLSNVEFAPGASTASLTLDITDDPGFEASETVIVGFGGPLSPEILLGTSNSVTITIPENDIQTVSVVTAAQEVAEGDSLKLEFSRLGGDHSQPLTLPLSLDGTSQASDYTLSSENVGLCSRRFHSQCDFRHYR